MSFLGEGRHASLSHPYFIRRIVVWSARVNGATLHGTEYQDEGTLRAMSIRGSPILVLVHQMLLESGIQTNGTVGSIMQALDLSRSDVNKLICCRHGCEITGKLAGERFAKLARPH